MTNIELIKQKAIDRGYSLYSKSADNFKLNYIRPDGLGLVLYPDTEEFEVYYNIDLITSITIGNKAGSFMNDKHFEKIEAKVEKYMNVIKLHNEEDLPYGY